MPPFLWKKKFMISIIRFYGILGLVLLLICACASVPRPIVAEPLEPHDRQRDHAACEAFARQFGVIDMEPVMAGSQNTRFADSRRQVQIYESCMLKKGYRFQGSAERP